MIEVNLLPKEYRKRGAVFSFDRKIAYVGGAVAAVVLVLAGFTFYQANQVNRLSKLIAKAKMEEARYKKDIAIIDALTEVKEKILARVDAIEKLDHRRSFYISLLEDINSRIPEFLWMTSFNETPPAPVVATAATAKAQPAKGAQQPGKNAPVQTQPTPANPDVGQATIEGFAYNLNSIGTFLIALMKSDFFSNIKLGRTASEDLGTVTAYNFKISCNLNYNAHLIRDELQDVSDEDLQVSSIHDQGGELLENYQGQ